MSRTIPVTGGTGSIGGWAVVEIENLRRGFDRYIAFTVVFDRASAGRC